MRGYKVFNSDWTCRGMQYEVGKTYEMEEKPIICERGFHFCEKAVDCFQYYDFDSDNKVAEIEAYGELDFEDGGNKHCTNKIKIVRELNWYEVLDLVNIGYHNTGLGNSGYYNTGDYNSGYYNTGDYNSGNRNSGYYNTGDYNSGNRNSGNRNTGDYNSGNRNTGDYNSGNRNTGNRNTGDYNSGNRNTGDYNSGNRNSGNRNTGDWNHASNCVGCFNTIDKPIMFFDKPSNITLEEWRDSGAYWLLNRIDFKPADWIYSSNMTDVEKENHPEYETTGGYLKIRDDSNCCIEWWKGLTDEEKVIIKDIPNFDSKKFSKIMNIPVELIEE